MSGLNIIKVATPPMLGCIRPINPNIDDFSCVLNLITKCSFLKKRVRLAKSFFSPKSNGTSSQDGTILFTL